MAVTTATIIKFFNKNKITKNLPPNLCGEIKKQHNLQQMPLAYLTYVAHPGSFLLA